MRRATTFAIGALLFFAIAIPARATIIPVAEAKDDGTSNSDPPLNFQPIAGCGLFANFDDVTPPVLPPGWTAINAIDPDGYCGRLLIQETQVLRPSPSPMPHGLTIRIRSAISTSTHRLERSIPSDLRFWFSGTTMFWRTGSTAACWRSALTVEIHSRTFLQPAVPFSVAAIMGRSAPVVAIPSLVVRRGQATRVVSSRLM